MRTFRCNIIIIIIIIIIIKGKKKEEREIFGSVTGGLVKDRIGAYVNNVIPYFDSPPVK